MSAGRRHRGEAGFLTSTRNAGGMRAKGEGAGAGDVETQPFPASLPAPTLPLGRSQEATPGPCHPWLEGPCWQAAEGTGWQEAGGLAKGADAKEIPFNTSFSTCPHCSALQCPLHSPQSPVPKQDATSHQYPSAGTLGTPLPRSARDAASRGVSAEQRALRLPPGHLHAPAPPGPVPGGPGSSPT